VCIDVSYGDVLSRRRFVAETFCMCAEKGEVQKSRETVPLIKSKYKNKCYIQ
jgi:hypothetical protein